MKKIHTLITSLSLFVSFVAYAQQNVPSKFPTSFGVFTFPRGSKVLLELRKVNNNKFEYRVLSMEPFTGKYSIKSVDNLYSKKNADNTVEIYFLKLFDDKGNANTDYNTFLVMRNNLVIPLNYKAKIKSDFSDEFENTDVTEALPGCKTKELWQQKVDFITLYNFEKKN